MGVPQFGLDQGGFHSNAELYSRTNPPVPEVAKWINRETEVLGWQKYLGESVAWAMQASLELGNEMGHSSRWPGPLTWGEMTMQ